MIFYLCIILLTIIAADDISQLSTVDHQSMAVVECSLFKVSTRSSLRDPINNQWSNSLKNKPVAVAQRRQSTKSSIATDVNELHRHLDNARYITELIPLRLSKSKIINIFAHRQSTFMIHPTTWCFEN